MSPPRTPHTSTSIEMEPQQQQQQQLSSLQLSDAADDQHQRDWASMPVDLLWMCLRALEGDRATKQAALASCKAFARAAVQMDGSLMLAVDRRAKFAPTARIWRELWGEEKPQEGQVVILVLASSTLETSGCCLGDLLGAGERLPFVSCLHLQGLALDVVLAEGVSTLLPNLRDLFVSNCALTPAARTATLDTACSKLQNVIVKALSAQPQAAPAGAAVLPNLQQLATAQLRQLAKLPSLSMIVFQDSSCPTLFLMALGTQLTRLDLHESYRQCHPGTQTPTAEWRAALQHVARCTGLRELHIPCQTAEELGLAAPALQQLRELCLNDPRRADNIDGDAVVDLLLSLPCLTSLRWDRCTRHTMTRWHNSRPCRWERLSLVTANASILARLPLHSLKEPVWCCQILVPEGTALQEVRAAAANVTRRCPAGFSWGQEDGLPELVLGGATVDPPAVLRALQPLFAPLSGIAVMSDVWDAAWVKVLGEVLPRTCERLALHWGVASVERLEQVARSLPWLRSLQLEEMEVSVDGVARFLRLARRLKGEQGSGAGAVRLEEVVVTRPACRDGESEQKRKRAWERAGRDDLDEERGGVAFRVEW